MSRLPLVEELKAWTEGDPEREALLINQAPIGKSTLRATLCGRYNPSPLLERALRSVMKEYPKIKTIPGGRSAATR